MQHFIEASTGSSTGHSGRPPTAEAEISAVNSNFLCFEVLLDALPSPRLKIFSHKISIWPTGHVVTLNQRPTAGHKAEISLNESRDAVLCIKT